MVKKFILFLVISGLLIVPYSLVGLSKSAKLGLGIAAGVLGGSVLLNRGIQKWKNDVPDESIAGRQFQRNDFLRQSYLDSLERYRTRHQRSVY